MAQETSEQSAVVADPRSAPANPNTPNKIRGVLKEQGCMLLMFPSILNELYDPSVSLTYQSLPQVGNTESVAANQIYTSTYPVTLSLSTAGVYKCAATYPTQTVLGQTLSQGTVFSGEAEIVVFGECACDLYF